MFANYVFFICLFGKMFFLYFTWRYMKKRLTHFYMHSIVSYHGIPRSLGKYFKGDYKSFDKIDENNASKKT